MKNKKTELMDRLLGFDSREFKRQMVEGLDEWIGRRTEASLTRRLCVPVLCATLLMVTVTYLATPVLNYRLGDGMSYETVTEKTDNLISL